MVGSEHWADATPLAEMAFIRESLSKEEKSAASSPKDAEFYVRYPLISCILGTGEPDGE